jgi:DNA-binding transcriptional LysR family regulator
MAARAHGLRSRSQETSAGTGKAATARKRLRPPRLLTYVDAVARHGSIRKAADALSVASSALNRQILDLETDLGTALFERLPRGVRLTAAGEVFSPMRARRFQNSRPSNRRSSNCAVWCAAKSASPRLSRSLASCCRPRSRDRALIEQVLARASFDLDPRLVSNSVEMMKAFARINRGVCFQFRRPGKAPIPPGDMIALPLIDPPLLQARLVVATRRGRVLPVAAAAFVELLKTVLA